MNKQDQEDRQRAMFGCTQAELEATLEEHAPMLGPHPARFMAVSMLSDAQELLERGQNERARQAINRAKFLIMQETSADVAVQKLRKTEGSVSVSGGVLTFPDGGVIDLNKE